MYEENQSPRNKNEKSRLIKDLSRVEADDVVVVGVSVGPAVDVSVFVDVLVVVEVLVVVVVGFA